MTVISRHSYDIPLSKEGIAKAIKILETRKIGFRITARVYRTAVAQKVEEIAQQLYSTAWYNDLVNGGKQEAPMIPSEIFNSQDETILVFGGAAVFIEFGAGISHNGGESIIFNSPHPYGGELGFTIGSYPPAPSQGINESWSSPVGVTRGTEAQMVLFRAVRMVEPYLEDIAKEVFGND